MKRNFKIKILCLFLIIPVLILLLGGVVMLLWNCILPEVFGVQKINFWQALGILLLCKILFGGFRSKIGGARLYRWRDCNKNCKSPFDHYTQEEKEIFKEKFKEKFPNFCNKK